MVQSIICARMDSNGYMKTATIIPLPIGVRTTAPPPALSPPFPEILNFFPAAVEMRRRPSVYLPKRSRYWSAQG